MELYTKRELLDNIDAIWKAEFARERQGVWEWRPAYPYLKQDAQTIHKKLLALGLHPTEEQVDAAIGTDSWTCIDCDECEREVEAVVQWKRDYEGVILSLCDECLGKATALLVENEQGA